MGRVFGASFFVFPPAFFSFPAHIFSVKSYGAELVFMDKRGFYRIFSGRAGRRLYDAFLFFMRSMLGVILCFSGVFITLSLVKNEADIFYYALAFASPGSAAEFLSGPYPSDEDMSTVSSDNSAADAQEIQKTPPKAEIPYNYAPFFDSDVPKERRGKVTEIQYSAAEGGKYIAYKNAIIKNSTRHSADEVRSMLKKEHSLSLSTEGPSDLRILIYHTHATEAFEPADRGYFDMEYGWRSTDPDKNMISVGAVLTSVLTEKGFGVIHDGTMHDDPSYNGSYQRSAETVKKHLSENPEIEIALDIHRDAIEPSATEIMKPTATINGRKAAQIMIIAGCDDGTMDMPDYRKNLRFAAALADKIEELYPGLCRPVLFDYRKYNMDLLPGLLLIEIGASGNTLEEAQYSAELLGNALAALFSE